MSWHRLAQRTSLQPLPSLQVFPVAINKFHINAGWKPALRLLLLLLFFLPNAAQAQNVDAIIDQNYSSLKQLYEHLHSNPELSYGEVNTSKRIATELRNAGFEVTENFGKYQDASRQSYGVVGVLKNGKGPTIMFRTDLDGLPVEEKTGLPYASKVRAKDDEGKEVSVMHACGHDMHMTVFTGVARAMAAMKDHWSGTLLLIGQPAEERAPGGAEAMLRAGLYEKFPKPDSVLAFHNDGSLQTGKVGWIEEYVTASVDTVDITVRGIGGHGANPHMTKDPVVIASELVLALQTIVSREVQPGQFAIVTVGSLHSGTKHNIISDEARLQMTVRSYKKEVRELLLRSIERITKGIAQAAGAPEPVIDLHPDRLVPATYNNPKLVQRLLPVIQSTIGKENVVQRQPAGVGEDFSHYSLDDLSVPCALFWLGSVDPKKMNGPLPSLHSPFFAPVPETSMKTGIKTMTAILLSLLPK